MPWPCPPWPLLRRPRALPGEPCLPLVVLRRLPREIRHAACGEAREARQETNKARQEAREGDVKEAKADMAKASADMAQSAKLSEKEKQDSAEAGKAPGASRRSIIDSNKKPAESIRKYKQAHPTRQEDQ